MVQYVWVPFTKECKMTFSLVVIFIWKACHVSGLVMWWVQLVRSPSTAADTFLFRRSPQCCSATESCGSLNTHTSRINFFCAAPYAVTRSANPRAFSCVNMFSTRYCNIMYYNTDIKKDRFSRYFVSVNSSVLCKWLWIIFGLTSGRNPGICHYWGATGIRLPVPHCVFPSSCPQ